MPVACDMKKKTRRESCCVELLEGFVRHFCVLTLDFVTVNYFPVVYVASRHFIILYIFVRQIIAPTLIQGSYLKRCTEGWKWIYAN